ncbi:MAG: tRNA (guanosine(37)-N1)-methyltransferase TrmD [Lachnospiraceae bacterium]|nr:tRNA (guanosine(37)-N1)-methyltransferase TrmD [Lachnospiraceae bacterium]
MNFHILTLFPEMVMQGLETSIIGRAKEKKLLSIEAVNIRDFTLDKHHKVDDYPYGGGAGMLMQAQPVYDCWKSVVDGIQSKRDGNLTEEMKKPIRTVYLTPQGRTFTQKDAQFLAEEEDLILLCGHYEGIDERVLETICTDYISIGDYVLTGGELPAMVLVDAVSRLVPGVLHNDVSADTESFEGNLLEYPQYSRPEEWQGKKVPQVLLSGDHRKIDEWRRIQSMIRTRDRRPDLLERAELVKHDRKLIDRVDISEEDRISLRKVLQDHLNSDKM